MIAMEKGKYGCCGKGGCMIVMGKGTAVTVVDGKRELYSCCGIGKCIVVM